jgi:hypothetical protein
MSGTPIFPGQPEPQWQPVDPNAWSAVPAATPEPAYSPPPAMTYGAPVNQIAMPPPPPSYPYGYPQPPTSATNGVGIAGFICGLLSAFLFWFPVVGVMLSLCGIGLSAGSLMSTKPSSNRGIAIAGLVIAILAFLPAMAVTLWVAAWRNYQF